MFQISVIGNLGGNAEVRSENGRSYITFRVGHNERYTDAQGNEHDETIWVSCLLNGDGGKLLQYLTAGRAVYVSGDGSLRTYHSKKMQRLVAGASINVRQIELIGGKQDAVPSALFDEEGVQHNIIKFYWSHDVKTSTLFNRAGLPFNVDPNGWVTPQQTNSDTNDAHGQAADNENGTSSDNDAPVFDGQGYETVEQAQEKEE